VIVNASAGVAPDSACNELQDISSGVVFEAGVAPQKIYCRARPRHSKKSCELLQIVKSLAGVAPDSACAAGFLSGVVCARAPQKIYCRARPRHLKKKS
jgi:hypothetical protein